MRAFSDFSKILEKHGFDGTTNVSDYYFLHRRQLDPLLFGPNVGSDEFASKVRWKSLRGIACVNAIKRYFEAKMAAKEREAVEWFREDRMLTDPNWQAKRGNARFDSFVTIDFEDFRFEFEERSWTLTEFAYSFQTGRISPQKDLIGIDLSGIHLHDVRLVNLCFGGACFDGGHLFQVELLDTCFPQASFRGARLMSIWAQGSSYFSSADISEAGVFGIHPLSDKTLSAPFKYTPISYWRLVFETLRGATGIKSARSTGWQMGSHTTFMNNTVAGLTLPETRSLKEYIRWYQYAMTRINDFRTAPILSQIGFIISTSRPSTGRRIRHYS